MARLLQLYWKIMRFFLFLLPPELAHNLGLSFLSSLSFLLPSTNKEKKNSSIRKGREKYKLGGAMLSHPLGLAAGLDKDGKAIGAFSRLGFSFMEIGTVTPLAQRGNPKPRLFRLPHSQGLLNRMGFNSEGHLAVKERLKTWQRKGRRNFPLGLNVGKNFSTELEEAHKDYCLVLQALYSYADFFVLNLSSPNTPGLRILQEELYLESLLRKVRQTWEDCAKRNSGEKKELLLKISPDMEKEERKKLVETAMGEGLSGLVAVNTTIQRENLSLDPRDKHKEKKGGISGKPLQDLALAHVAELRKWMGQKPLLISVGGIDSVEEGKKRLSLGANLLEAYTGLIYKGPSLPFDFQSHFLK